MMLSPIGRGDPSAAGSLRFDLAAPDFDIERRISALRAWATPIRAWARTRSRANSRRGAAHALLADASGAWAWRPGDRYAAAKRHADLREWMDAHPDTDMQLWVSGDLMRGLDEPVEPAPRDDALWRSEARRVFVARHGHAAASWPLATWHNHDAVPGVLALAGLDLEAVCRHGRQHGVHVASVMPWWHHAFVQAKRCVPRIELARTARVCVVEGRNVAWIVAEHGVLKRVRRLSLREARVDSLRQQMQHLSEGSAAADVITVVLGQGLIDGGHARGLDGLVLGRLDGDQPPQWLRP